MRCPPLRIWVAVAGAEQPSGEVAGRLSSTMSFPETRPRRLRRTPALRRLVRETTLAPDNFIYPLFVCPGKGVRREISSLPGQFHFSVDEAVARPRRSRSSASRRVILFGLPEKKDEVGSEAWHDEGVVQQAMRAIKKAVPELVLAVDACFCEYTTHGHCGVVVDGEIDNDATLENLGRAALSYARAGADLVAPSGMMDGFVGFLRESLDEDGFEQVGLLAYSAKYASGYYGPFRDRRRLDAGVRRSHRLPDGSGQRARGDARGRARRRGGRRHRHGQAGARLPGRHRRGAATSSTCRSPPTTSRASTRCSRPPPRRAGSTTTAPCWRR